MTKLIFRGVFSLFLLVVCLASFVDAQESGWCGYILLDGLPLLSNQLNGFEAITPDKSSTVQPSALFQYRFSLDHSKVIVEGCWKVDPTRDIAISLLSQSIEFDQKLMQAQVDQAIQEAITKGGGDVTADQVVREYVDSKLLYSIFAPGASRDKGAAEARAYIAANLKEWEASDSQ